MTNKWSNISFASFDHLFVHGIYTTLKDGILLDRMYDLRKAGSVDDLDSVLLLLELSSMATPEAFVRHTSAKALLKRK